MDNFVGLLKQRGDGRYGHRDFERIPAGRFSASVQASRTHYCTPRETLLTLDAYTAFEIAIFQGEGEDEEWVIPPRDPRLKDKSWAQLFEDSDSTSVAGYVPRQTIQQILDDLEAITEDARSAK